MLLYLGSERAAHARYDTRWCYGVRGIPVSLRAHVGEVARENLGCF